MVEEHPSPEGQPVVSAQTAVGSQQPEYAQLDDSGVQALYANLCRVASTPEEVILDLALNSNPLGQPAQPIRISQRVVLNHYTAKRLAGLLAAAVQRHEQTFGVLETDIRKRMRRTAGGDVRDEAR